MTADAERRLPSIDVAAFSAPAPPPPILHTASTPAERPDHQKRATSQDRPMGERTTRPAKRVSASPDIKIVTVGVKVASSTRELLRSAAAVEASLTQTGVMLGAIAASRTKLVAEFAHHGDVAGPFETMTTVRRSRHEEAWVQVSLRVTEKDLKVIDEIVRECNAPDRSRMVDTALRLYLIPPNSTSPRPRVN